MNTKFMEMAIKEAEKAFLKEEVPVGCVIVKDGKILSKAHNLKHTKNIAIHHAEILAIQKACQKVGNWRLDDCELYVTLEPCVMCAGAIVQSRIRHVYFGAYDEKVGFYQNNRIKNLNHYPIVQGGILEEECSQLLKKFFSERRKK